MSVVAFVMAWCAWGGLLVHCHSERDYRWHEEVLAVLVWPFYAIGLIVRWWQDR